jgi:hypothetical protein
VPCDYLTVKGEWYNISRPKFRNHEIKIKYKERRLIIWKKQ